MNSTTTSPTVQPDIEQIQSTLALFTAHSSIGEIRIIGNGAHGYYFDQSQIEQAATIAARESNTAKGVYVVMNGVDSALADRPRLTKTFTTTKDIDIESRRWLLIDFDPASPERGPNDSATDAEKQAAKDLQEQVFYWLHERGWPEPVVCDSGNGWHLLYRIDLPNDERLLKLVKSLLNALADRFSTDAVGVDRAVSNAARITKCYGTLARKGENRPDRPHRLSSVVYVPEDLYVVSEDQIRDVIDELANDLFATAAAPDDAESIPTNGHTPPPPATTGTGFKLPAMATPGSRHATLLSWAGYIRHGGGSYEEIYDCLKTIQRTRGCDKPDEELRQIARDYATKDSNMGLSALMAGESEIFVDQKVRQQRLKAELADVAKKIGNSTPGEIAKQLAVIQSEFSAATSTYTPPLWAGDLIDQFPEMRPPVFEGLLRQGETMNAIAAPKTGKSWLSLGMAFSVCMGRDWLDTFPTTAGKVLLVDNELHAETISKRLRDVAQAMNLTRADYQDRIAVKPLRGQLQDLHQLAEDLKKCPRGEFTLIVLDAWYRLQPKGSDENANADVTRLYDLLDSVSHQIGSAFVAIHHTTKGSQGEKAVTDTGSGAGSMSRAADTHLVLREHEFPDAIVVDAAVRSFPRITPFVIQRMHPLWVRAEHLDPSDIKVAKPRKRAATGSDGPNRDEQRQNRERERWGKLWSALESYPNGETKTGFKLASGLDTKQFEPLWATLLRQGDLVACDVVKNRRPESGFKWTGARKCGQINPTESDHSGHGRRAGGIGPPLLRGTESYRPTEDNPGDESLDDLSGVDIDPELQSILDIQF